LIFLAITIALIAGAVSQEIGINAVLDGMAGQPQKEIFKAFHFLHEKTYPLNSEEGIKRYRIFKENVQFIKEKNAEEGEEIYGITQFADMTHTEFKEYQIAPEVMSDMMKDLENKSTRFLQQETVKHEHFHHHEHVHHHGDNEVKRDDHNLQEKTQGDNHNLRGDINWTKYDGPIKNQRTCGSCWAFAAIGAIENEYHKLKGTYTPFSEQYLVDCDHKDGGCRGGWPSNTFRWIADNGIVHENTLKYVGKQGACDAKNKVYEYKIVKGAWYHSPQSYYSQGTFMELLAKGPLVVAMDASFREFGHYRPKTYRPIQPTGCTNKVTHAVYVTGRITENGKQYYVARNSWGERWGYKGYFKIPVNNCCMIDNWGWMPRVYDGFVPNNNHPPKPKPTPSDCVKFYGSNGFYGKVIKEACDSLPNFGGQSVRGVKFPEKTVSPNGLRVGLFYYTDCYGKGSPNYDSKIVAESSLEFPRLNGVTQWSSSFAFMKKAEDGCVNFYTKTCLQGESSFSICNNIKDSQDVQLGELKNVGSINIDEYRISKIVFYDKPHYQGRSYTATSSLFNVGSNWNLGQFLKRGGVRSIKIFSK